MASHLPRKRASLGETPNTPIGENIITEETIIENKQVNRNRPITYSFRVSEKEKRIIDEKVKASGLSRTDFLIKALTDKPVTVIDSGNEILTELKRQGNNLHQAVRNCYFRPSETAAVIKAANACKEVYKILFTALGG